MPYKKDSTIKDVSRLAGVSISTVSRVLNEPEKVAPETRQRVRQAIDTLNFTPISFLARTHMPQKDKPVIFFIPDLFNETLLNMVQGASNCLMAQEINSIIWSSSESRDWEFRGYQSLLNKQVQGAILILSVVEDRELSFAEFNIPMVMIERPSAAQHVDIVSVDADQGMLEIVGHLMSLGHQNIGLLCGDISSGNALRKVTSYKKALQESGLPWNPNYIVSTEWNLKGGSQGVQRLLEWSPEVTAVIGISDVLARGVLHGIAQIGLKCPGDLSVVGFDKMPAGDYYFPKLTTLDYPGYEMGRQAALFLLERLKNNNPPQRRKNYPLQLITGDTSGPVRNGA